MFVNLLFVHIFVGLKPCTNLINGISFFILIVRWNTLSYFLTKNGQRIVTNEINEDAGNDAGNTDHYYDNDSDFHIHELHKILSLICDIYFCVIIFVKLVMKT